MVSSTPAHSGRLTLLATDTIVLNAEIPVPRSTT
jgi:hypothetical protein